MFLDTTRARMANGLPTPPDSAGCSTSGEPIVTTWLIDTRTIWQGNNIFSAHGAAKALALVSTEEQTIITSKMFIADARMSLASALLKRLFISQALNIPWKDVKIARKGDPKHGKPCAVDHFGIPIEGLDFNISHQNGLVALIGFDARTHGAPRTLNNPLGYPSPSAVASNAVTVGVDIVCVNERDDYRTIEEEGLDGWVDIYDIIFSDEERWSMKYDVDYVTMLDGTHVCAEELGRNDRCIARNQELIFRTPSGRKLSMNSEQLIEAKLRRFYTYFCYKEAYIKLSGEALLAPWIKELEFFNVRSPKPGCQARCSTHGLWGEEVEDVDVHLHKKEIGDVKMKIQAFEEDFMISTAMQGDIEGLKVPGFNTLNIDADVMEYAQANLFEMSPSKP